MTDARLSEAIATSPFVARLLRSCSFSDGAVLPCAVSGGADSVALAVLASRSGCSSVVLHHVDHGLRPASSTEASAVATLADRLGAAFVAHTVEVGDGPNLEERARQARYGALPLGVATGHTADDLAETMVLHLLRGAGLDGLASMARADRGGPQRPLLRLRRSDTVALCTELGLDTFADPMNDDARFRRVRVRHELLPLMDDIAQRDVATLLARHCEIAAADVALLDELSSSVDPQQRWGLVGVAAPLARRALRRWLVENGVGQGHSVDAATIDRVMDVALGETPACDVVGGWRVARTDGLLRLLPPTTGTG